MVRRIASVILLTVLVLSIAACHNKRVQNPIANVDSKQPDKGLFDRAMDAMKHNKFDVARLQLQTLINAYPDSEYIARAKLAIGDSWYAEGGTAALTQAENEYKDFITFFPNMPEAAEAQMKIANIHYRQMEKADRDFTHAKRAEEEYRTMVLQYPDHKLVPEAMQRLREVQEILADREYMIGRFYYLRESWSASIARLQSLVDTYPLYSGADEALFMLGQSYERQYDTIRQAKIAEAVKERLGKEFADRAADAYSRILTRYPVMARAEDAKKRLEALGRPVPKATEAAVAQNKAEEESRSETGTVGRMKLLFHKGPDMAQAARVGEPTLVDPKQTGAPDVNKAVNEAVIRAAGAASGQVTVEPVKTGAPPASQPAPRSDTPTPPPDSSGAGGSTPPAANPAAAAKPADTGIPELQPLPDPEASAAAPAAATSNANNAKPAQAAQPTTQAPPPAPAQVNEAAQPNSKPDQAAADKNKKDDNKDSSSSKKKKKKGKKFLVF